MIQVLQAGRTPPKLVLFVSGEFGLGLAAIAVGRAFPSGFVFSGMPIPVKMLK